MTDKEFEGGFLMTILELITRKRDGGGLSDEEIDFLIGAFVEGRLPDYQMAAFLMAVFHRGLSPHELVAFTRAMGERGEHLDLSGLNGAKVDKHSTGGVGDKTSLILTPLMASLGVKVPMMAGRSLGFTGGTIDKMESIPGFRTDLTLKDAKDLLKKVGGVIMAQSDQIAPADKKLYSLRDVTATIESIPLLASSIVSKKFAEGIDSIVFDVKFGEGAFLPEKRKALQLAKTLVAVSKKLNLKSVAVLSSMEQPLGFAVGNTLEVMEAIEVMKGRGPQDLIQLTLALAGWMLILAGEAADLPEALQKARKSIEEGAALKKFREIVNAQGGDGRVVENILLLPQAAKHITIVSPKSGFLKKILTRRLGELLRVLGAGRMQLGDPIDSAVGFVLYKKIGDSISKGETLGTVHVNSSLPMEASEKEFESLFEIASRKVNPPALLGQVVR